MNITSLPFRIESCTIVQKDEQCFVITALISIGKRAVLKNGNSNKESLA